VLRDLITRLTVGSRIALITRSRRKHLTKLVPALLGVVIAYLTKQRPQIESALLVGSPRRRLIENRNNVHDRPQGRQAFLLRNSPCRHSRLPFHPVIHISPNIEILSTNATNIDHGAGTFDLIAAGVFVRVSTPVRAVADAPTGNIWLGQGRVGTRCGRMRT
jgi:hypothetical protein